MGTIIGDSITFDDDSTSSSLFRSNSQSELVDDLPPTKAIKLDIP